MKKAVFSLIIFAALFGIVSGQVPFELDKVKSIKVMESSRDDVRRIFAGYQSKSVESYEHYDEFFVKDAKIEFIYSEGECNKYSGTYDFAVPEWKVVSIVVTPKSQVSLKKININLKELEKQRISTHNPNTKFYAHYDKESGLLIRSYKGKIEDITFLSPSKYYEQMCQPGNGEHLIYSLFNPHADYAAVTQLAVSRMEITADCQSSDSTKIDDCSDTIKTINVSTKAVDPENDPLTYAYIITAGKIVGTGAKVVWDLTGVKPGTYTITAAVDDGCGFCGQTFTKTIIVKECDKCQ